MAKQPQDHLPKKPTVEDVDGGKRVTLHGVTVTVPTEAIDDWELLEELDALDRGKGQKLPSVLRRLVGDDYSMVIDSLRGKNGRVSIARGTEFVTDLLGSLNPN